MNIRFFTIRDPQSNKSKKDPKSSSNNENTAAVAIIPISHSPSTQNATKETRKTFSETLFSVSSYNQTSRQSHLDVKHQTQSGPLHLCVHIERCAEIDCFQLHVV
jgi:hypothetical protein